MRPVVGCAAAAAANRLAVVVLRCQPKPLPATADKARLDCPIVEIPGEIANVILVPTGAASRAQFYPPIEPVKAERYGSMNPNSYRWGELAAKATDNATRSIPYLA